MFKEYLEHSKDAVTRFLAAYPEHETLPGSKGDFSEAAVYKDLYDFTTGGKMLRGALCRLGFELFSRREDPAVTALGAAVELVQSAFLIHDDIMDRDTLRRGRPAMHTTWKLRAEERNLPDAEHLGESLAICAGDLAIFYAYRIIAGYCGPAAADLTALFSRHLSSVTAAQMLDTAYGAGWSIPSEDAVLNLYARKTGHYTFSLPLAAGALPAAAPEGAGARLERAGELLGIAFQLKDDELGIFGDEEELGKPVGSDIREGKKTIHYLRLAGREDGRSLTKLFGRPDVSEDDIHRIRRYLNESGIREEVAGMMQGYTADALDIVTDIPGLREKPLNLLKDLAEYNLSRGR